MSSLSSDAKSPAQTSTRPILLTLDAFDTLFTPKEPIPIQYADTALTYGIQVDPEDIAKAFPKVFKHLNRAYPNYGKYTTAASRAEASKDGGSADATIRSPRQWWERIIRDTFTEVLGPSAEIPPELINALYHRFSSSAGYSLFYDVPLFLQLISDASSAKQWAPARTMLGVITNSDPRVKSILSSFNITIHPSLFPPRLSMFTRFETFEPGRAHFAFATYSYEAGAAKPDPRIFDIACSQAQRALFRLHHVARLTRSGTELLHDINQQFHHLHVGDDLKKDVIPALNAGWDAILLDRAAEEEISERVTDSGMPYTVVSNLLALFRVVTKERLEKTHDQREVWKKKGTARHRMSNRILKEKKLGRVAVPDPANPDTNRRILS